MPIISQSQYSVVVGQIPLKQGTGKKVYTENSKPCNSSLPGANPLHPPLTIPISRKEWEHNIHSETALFSLQKLIGGNINRRTKPQNFKRSKHPGVSFASFPHDRLQPPLSATTRHPRSLLLRHRDSLPPIWKQRFESSETFSSYIPLRCRNALHTKYRRPHPVYSRCGHAEQGCQQQLAEPEAWRKRF